MSARNGWTRHGHAIRGVVQSDPRPAVARCGGPGLCSGCSIDAAGAQPIEPVTPSHARAVVTVQYLWWGQLATTHFLLELDGPIENGDDPKYGEIFRPWCAEQEERGVTIVDLTLSLLGDFEDGFAAWPRAGLVGAPK